MAEIATSAPMPTMDYEVLGEESGLAACARCQQVHRLLAILELCVAEFARLDAQFGVDHSRPAPHSHDPLLDASGSSDFGQWVSWGGLRLEQRSRRGFRATQELHLTSNQFKLLWVLCAARGAVVSTDELSHAMYGQRTGNDRDRVYAHIRRVRRLIELDPTHATVLVAVRGEGFRIAEAARTPGGIE